MIRKALLAATLASGLIVPATAGVYLPPKPAIVKPENIEFSKHLLAMPFTMGILSAGKGSVPVSVILRNTTLQSSSTASTTFTFSTVSIGTASSTRYVIAQISAVADATAGVTLSSVTIGGVTATIHASQAFGAGATHMAYIAGATVPTGTTATVAVTFSAATSSCAVYVTSIDGLQSTTPVTTGSGNGNAGASTANTGAVLTYPANGFAVGVATKSVSTTTTWAGGTLTKQSEGTYGTTVRTISNADALPTTTSTGNTATVNYPVSGQQCLAVATFR